LARKALDAMGGEQKLRNLETVRFKAIGQRNMLKQSERPEGPYMSNTKRFPKRGISKQIVYVRVFRGRY
jgi:hypothetical protein